MRGQVLDGRFAIEAEGGSGGFGSVWRATDLRTGAAVALKLLHAARGEQTDDARFAREAKLLAELRHPGIVAYVADGVLEDGRRYLAMEWLDGESLEDRLAREPLSVAESLALLRRIASALDVAHRRGIVHRDLKPSNLFLRDRDVLRVTLLDLGIARRPGLSVTRTGQVMGTPRYMAPEQAWGRDVTTAADVFALGCVAFECLTGRAAFVADHPAAALAKVLFEDAPDPITVRGDLPKELAALVHRMLGREASDRPADAAALLAALDAIPAATDGPPPELPRGAPSFGRDELRLASVVFARPAEGDASAIDAMLHEGSDDARAHLERREEDGALVATFLHEGPSAVDQAANAAAFAHQVRARIPGACIVVVTGRVRGSDSPDGEVVDRARALLRAASPAITLDDVTLSLVQGTADESRPLLGLPTPCVGRDQELATLELVVASCADEPAARAVLVTAEPGTGKSRLRHELVRRLAARGRDVQVLVGRADALRVGSSYGLLASALAPLFVDREGLRARVERHLRGDDAERVADFLGELAGLSSDPGTDDSPRLRGARLDPRTMQTQVMLAWLDFVRAECRERPVLLILEDLHWSDAASLDLVDVALRELPEAALCVIGFARPEIAERRPGLWRGRVQELPLRPLGRRACERLVREILGGAVSDAIVEKVVAQSAGNALFLEELIRAAHAGQTETPPPTVLAMLQARIGQLDPALRRVLRAASILGETFAPGAVAAVLGEDDDVDRSLAELARGEIVELRRSEPGSPYRFRHALMRDAAYALLTDEDRRLGHRAAARFLDAEGAPPALVAEHFVAAGDFAGASRHLVAAVGRSWALYDIETMSRLARRGVELGFTGADRGALLAVLGNQCIHTWEWQRAIALASEAIDLLRPGSEWWSRCVNTLIAAYAYTQDVAAARALAERYFATDPREGAVMQYVESALHVASAMIQIGASALGRRGLDRVDALAKDLGGFPSVRAFYCLIRNTWLRHTSDLLGPQIAFGVEAVALYEDLGAAITIQTLARDVLAEVVCRAGLRARGEAIVRRCLLDANAQDQPYFRSHANLAAAHGLAVWEDPEADREVESLARAVLATKGISSGYEAMARHLLAQVLGRRGEREAAIAEADRAIALSEHTPVRRLQMLATRAWLAADPAEARSFVDAALALLEEMGGEGGYAEAHAQAVAIDVLRRTGDADRAAKLAARAKERLAARRDSLEAPADREAFLVNVPLHRRIFAS